MTTDSDDYFDAIIDDLPLAPRDQFAIAALPNVIDLVTKKIWSASDTTDEQTAALIAKHAYMIADAMLAESAK